MKGCLKEVRPGVWHCWFDLPRREDGKRRQKKATIYATGKRDAENQRAKLIAEANAGNIAAPTKETVESYLTGWLTKRKADGLSPKTLETWHDFSRAYIVPHIGKVVLERLTPKQVDDFYAKLRLSGRRRGTGGLSPRTVLHIHRLLSECLKSAVRLQLIPRNPCDGLAPKGVVIEERELVRTFDEAAVCRLLGAADGTWLHIPVLLATGMGMRRGECLGLRWSDVDFKSGMLSVRNSVQQLRGEGIFNKKPKGEKTRTIAMPEFIAATLQRHRAAQNVHVREMGEAWNDQAFVIADPLGNPRSPGSLTHAFADLIEKLGLPRLTFHDLRHVNATLLLLAGVPDKVVSERLGHCDTRITRDLYQHVLPRMDEEAARKTDEYFRRAFGG